MSLTILHGAPLANLMHKAKAGILANAAGSSLILVSETTSSLP